MRSLITLNKDPWSNSYYYMSCRDSSLSPNQLESAKIWATKFFFLHHQVWSWLFFIAWKANPRVKVFRKHSILTKLDIWLICVIKETKPLNMRTVDDEHYCSLLDFVGSLIYYFNLISDCFLTLLFLLWFSLLLFCNTYSLYWYGWCHIFRGC